MKVAVIGGGAAGFFAAIAVKSNHPKASVTIFEKSDKLLSKVKISGGGRCNVTNHCLNNRLLSENYPRGEKFMRKALEQFSVKDTIQWFENRSVQLKTEPDNRMFPVTDNSMTIVNALLDAAMESGVVVKLKSSLAQLLLAENGWKVIAGATSEHFDRVIVASGGSAKKEGLHWLEQLGHRIIHPVPSLFTFNMPNEPIRELMGLSVSEVEVRVVGTSLSARGPLLITHWGMSGPAVLKCSAFGARILADMHYKFQVMVNWVGKKEHELRQALEHDWEQFKKRKVSNRNPFRIPERLWQFLLEKSEVDPEKSWMELPKKSLNKLINTLMNDTYQVDGKTTFKEEFVTAGGVSLEDVDPNSMKSRVAPNLYFAGEVLDIDGVTGGFNFQAAWTAGFIAGKLR